MKKLKAIDVKGIETIYKTYKVVPYPEITKIINNGGEAFIEGIDRRTAYSAKKILSKNLGFEVKGEKRIIIVKAEDDYSVGTEGYLFFRGEEDEASSSG